MLPETRHGPNISKPTLESRATTYRAAQPSALRRR